MINTLSKYVLMAIVALILALVPFPFIVQQYMNANQVSNDPWHINLATGSPSSGPYLRTFVARRGLFALTVDGFLQ